MKINTLLQKIFAFSLVMIMGVSGLSAQSQNITLPSGPKTVAAAFEAIERQTSMTVAYNDSRIDVTRTFNENVTDRPLSDALATILRGTGATYRVQGNRIIIVAAAASAAASAAAQQRQVAGLTGHVVDEAGEPIVGATVNVVGTNNTTVTDTNGNFAMQAPSDATLQAVFFGYVTTSANVGGRTEIAITMPSDTRTIDDVVVVGYGTQKKVNLTGAIANVKTAELSAIPNSNLSNSLAGRAPGVTIVGNSGLTGASSSIRMRGAFGEPLYVIDGVVSNKRAFDALDATEIDQMSFLKDAATASIYGSSAGNGVVLVTTKKGNAGISKPRFEYQGSYSISNTTRPLFTDMYTATDQLIYQNRVAEFLGQALPNGDDEFAYFKNRDYNVNDWIWQNPWNTKHAISVDGGSENIQYFLLANFQKEEGSFKSLENNKYNIRSNVTAKLSKAISLNVNLSAYQVNGRRFFWPAGDYAEDHAVADMYRGTFNAMHTLPFYTYEDGTPAEVGDMTAYSVAPDFGAWKGWNPVEMVIGNRYVKSRRRNVNGTITLNVDLGAITEGLSTRVLFNYTGNDLMRKQFYTWQKNYFFQPADPDNRFVPGPVNLSQYQIFNNDGLQEHVQYHMEDLWSEQFNWFVDYNRTFGKHGVTATAVFEQAKNGGEAGTARAEKPLTNIDQWYVYSTDRANRNAEAGEYAGGRLSWIGRVNYNFDEKYIAEFSFRYDGNSLFAPGKRWGFFPSVSAAWRVTQENFMRSSKNWLSDLKLRASYGTMGNDLDVNNERTAAFQYIAKYGNSGSSYIFGDAKVPVIAPSVTPNPNLTWATITSYNAGLDFGFLNQRLTGTVDVFLTKETDILGSRTVTLPGTYGTTLAAENYAARSKRGFEVSLGWQDLAANGNVRYAVYANMGYAKDRWDVLDQSALYTTGNLQGLSRIGRSATGFHTGLIAVDLVRTQEQLDELKAAGFKQWGRDPYLGAIIYKDTHGAGYAAGPDGIVDANDTANVLSDNATPRLNYGFGGEIEWKGISLSAHFQGVGPYDKFVSGLDGGFWQWGGAARPYFPIWTSDEVWTPENIDGKYPRITGNQIPESGTNMSTFWKRNGAYLRLKNLNIGYQLPKAVTNFLSLEAAQVYFNGTNLFVISEINEFHDPEQLYYDSYPLMKTFTFGLKFSF